LYNHIQFTEALNITTTKDELNQQKQDGLLQTELSNFHLQSLIFTVKNAVVQKASYFQQQ
jgi:hypothetical protein